jgi:hypothetical protein
MPVPMRANKFWTILSGLEQAYAEIRTKFVGIPQIFTQQGLFSGNFLPLARLRRDSAQACARFRPKCRDLAQAKRQKFQDLSGLG